MTTFTFIILITFVCIQVGKFMMALETENYCLAPLFGAEIIAFVYLAKNLM